MAIAGEPGTEERPNIKTIKRPVVEQPAPEPMRVYEESEPVYNPVYDPPPRKTCTVTKYRPVWKTRDVRCTRPVCRYREEVRTCKVPVYNRGTTTRQVTCWKTEYETRTQTVTKCMNCADACGCCSPVQVTCEVPCQVPVRVPYVVEQQIPTVTCDWETKEYTVQIPYTETEEFTCQQNFCEMEPYQVEVAACCAPKCRCQRCCKNPGLNIGLGFRR